MHFLTGALDGVKMFHHRKLHHANLASGFVGKFVLSFLGKDNFQIWNRNETLQLGGVCSVIHLAGKAHDLKNTFASQEYYEVNTELTKKVYDAFLASEAKVFITLSSVKAAADQVEGE